MNNKQFQFSKPLWHVTKDKKLLETPIFSLSEKQVIPDGADEAHPFYVIHAPEWINIIAMDHQKHILLVEQYRHGIDDITLEIPGGMVDSGEAELSAARRELLEETGYHSENWTFLGKTSSNPAILDNFTHLYLAENCSQISAQKMDGTEDIKVHKIPIHRFLELVKEGVVHHAIVLAAVSKLLLRKPELYDQ